MSPTAQIEEFAQQVYLVIKNREFDDIAGEDGQTYIRNIIRFTNMFLGELETTLDSNDQIVDWWFARENGYELGTVSEGDSSLALSNKVDRLITDEERYLQIKQGDSIVSSWSVVNASELSNNPGYHTEDMCAVVGNYIVFSRPFNDTENGGTVVGDVILSLPRLSTTNVKIFSMVSPMELLTLGVAKNSSLPDIVQGVLSPSFTQKYNDLLKGAIARSEATSRAKKTVREQLSYIRGAY